jgi:endonuclease/exonuclease/phosphatase family metal-dependent hydrolase
LASELAHPVRFAANHLSLRQQSTSRGWQLLTALVKSSLMHTHP